MAYRLTLADPATGQVVARFNDLRQPECELAQVGDASGARWVATLEVKNGDGNGWAAAGPPAHVRIDGSLALSWDGASPIHRVMVRDPSSARIVADEIVLGSSTSLDLDALDPSHDLRYGVQAWSDGTWENVRPWAPLPLEAILGPPHTPAGKIDPHAPPALIVMFTIDTECGVHRMRHPDPSRAVDELIFGDFGHGEQLGIGLQMDLLEHFGHRGCFFVDILLEHQFGQRALERVLEAILSRGHEVELHVHPHHLGFSRDPNLQDLARTLETYDSERFRRVMELSVELFEHRVGRRPLAYRSGGYYVNDGFLSVVSEHGIAIDSSVHVYSRARVAEWMRTRTQPFRLGELLELPPSWFLRTDETPPGPRQYAPNPTAGDPFTFAVGEPDPAEPMLATYVSHSFQLLQFRAEGEEFSQRWRRELRELAAPDQLERLMPWDGHRFNVHEAAADEQMVATVAALLRRVAESPNARCATFAELHAASSEWWHDRRTPVDPVPTFNARDGETSTFHSRIYTRGLLAVIDANNEEAGPEQPALLTHPLLQWHGRDVVVIGREPGDEWFGVQAPASVARLDEIGALSPGSHDIVVWLEGVELRDPFGPEDALDRIKSALRPGGVLLLGVRTLGTTGNPALPPLAELLFPMREIEAALGEPCVPAVALDGTAVRALLRSAGFEPVVEQRHQRSRAELAAIDHHSDKLGWLDAAELRAGKLEVISVRELFERPRPIVAARERDPLSSVDADATRCEPAGIDDLYQLAGDLYTAIQPGAGREVRFARDPAGALTLTVVRLALEQAGIEVLEQRQDHDGLWLRCSRPLELDDIIGLGK